MQSDVQQTIPGADGDGTICSFPWGWAALNEAAAAIQSAHRKAAAGKFGGGACPTFRDELLTVFTEQPICRLVDGLMIADAKRDAILFNTAFAKLFGIRSDLPQPHTSDSFYGPAEPFIVAFAKNNSVAPLRAPRSLRFTFARSDWLQFSAEVWSTCVRSDSGHVIAFVDIVRDLSATDWISTRNCVHETLTKYHLSRWCAAASRDLRSALVDMQISLRQIERSSCMEDVRNRLQEIDCARAVLASIGEVLSGAASDIIQEI
jgi:hypothetical protein